jgi:nitroimidazol reductase NimA-like FMN-containing flavoprotein (pyridoxamine 5'-phosphate oxidase superfamily)
MAKENKKKQEESTFEDVVVDGHYKIVDKPKEKEIELITAIDFLKSSNMLNAMSEFFVEKKYLNDVKTQEEWIILFKKDKLIK